jgi:hypothetical protein
MNHATPQPLIVNFAPTGMVPTKAAMPHMPVGPGDIFEPPVTKPTTFRALGLSNRLPSVGTA